nr:Retrovirus-related Pol polyprotein from transposon TNT 1-94 [Ipomoea batatas]GMD72670.1 Retrovirus-related Pol polyprotein from transposon TNT 1-94 [Ipomoea batatas]
MQKMKETKSLKDYSERLQKVVNKIRLLGEELLDDRVVEKNIDLLHALEAQEQRRAYRNESNIEGAFKANDAQVADEEQEEEQLFVATCFASQLSSIVWLIDSGCTNHITFDESLFREIDKTVISKVKIGNRQYIEVKGKGIVAIEGPSGIKLIYDVMFVPKISQNLLSVGQLLEKGYSVIFKNNMCFITDSCGVELFFVKMKDKSFCLDYDEVEFKAYP